MTPSEARKAFKEAYSKDTFNVVRRRVERGESVTQIADALELSTASVGAIIANHTRGTYDWYTDRCEFRTSTTPQTSHKPTAPRSSSLPKAVDLLADGWTTEYVARKLRMARSRVAAFQANLTRGVYDHLLAAE